MTYAMQFWFFLVTLAILVMLAVIYSVLTDMRDLLNGLKNVPSQLTRLERLLIEKKEEGNGNG